MEIPVFQLERAFLDRRLSRVERRLRGVEASSSIQEPKVKNLPLPRASFSLSRALKPLLQVVILISFLSIVVVFAPWAYYTFAPVETVPVNVPEPASALGGEYSAQAPRRVSQPPKDESLPTGSWISIPSIGVRTELRPTEDPEEALRKGVWLAPEYGQPGATDQPMIVVAHRFGYKVWWQDDYWKYNSFYNLPHTQPGDLVEVIHDQRKWVYEIYAGEEGEEITDYSADMILYTCKYLNSPIRHFRYARLVDLSATTQ